MKKLLFPILLLGAISTATSQGKDETKKWCFTDAELDRQYERDMQCAADREASNLAIGELSSVIDDLTSQVGKFADDQKNRLNELYAIQKEKDSLSIKLAKLEAPQTRLRGLIGGGLRTNYQTFSDTAFEAEVGLQNSKGHIYSVNVGTDKIAGFKVLFSVFNWRK